MVLPGFKSQGEQRLQFFHRTKLSPSSCDLHQEDVRLVKFGVNLFIETKRTWNRDWDVEITTLQASPLIKGFQFFSFFQWYSPNGACSTGSSSHKCWLQIWGSLACISLYKGVVHSRNIAFCTRIPAEHLGALLKLSPSAFLFQNVGAQSEWSLKLLALEQPAWKTLDGSELPVPWSLKCLWFQQFSEGHPEKEKKKSMLLESLSCFTVWSYYSPGLEKRLFEMIKWSLVNIIAGLIRRERDKGCTITQIKTHRPSELHLCSSTAPPVAWGGWCLCWL